MVALSLKIIIAAFLLMFLDLLIAPWLPKGGIPIGIYPNVEYFTLITLLIRIFEILAAFIVLIIHAITHLLAVVNGESVFINDIALLIEGVISLFLWLVSGFLTLFLHMLSLPFVILDMLFPDMGWGIKLDIGDITAGILGKEGRIGLGGVLIDLRTLTFQIQIGELNPLSLLGIDIYVSNTIGFSLLGNEGLTNLKLIGGSTASWYKTGVGAFGIIIDFKDGIYTCFPDLGLILECISENIPAPWQILTEGRLRDPFKCIDPARSDFKCIPISLILETPSDWKVLNLVDMFNNLIAGLGFPTPKVWIEKVYSHVIPALGSQSTFLTEVQNCIKVRKWQVNRMI